MWHFSQVTFDIKNSSARWGRNEPKLNPKFLFLVYMLFRATLGTDINSLGHVEPEFKFT
jgi:hypothetical protein